MATNPQNQLRSLVEVSEEAVSAEILDPRPNSISMFEDLTEPQRQQLATDAWSIGLRALANAHAQAQEARLQDVGKTLLDDVDRLLKGHVDSQQQIIATVLSKYFDPNDGQVAERLGAFMNDEGVLARLLEKYLGDDGSVLAQTLARQVGEQSELFKKLSPTDSEGLVKILEAQFRSVLNDGHAELLRALDPLAENGAVARFLKSLREDLATADEDRAKQLQKALAALDANDDNSLISRMMRETATARQSVLEAVNPESPDSPMAMMKASLTELLKDYAKTQQEALELQRQRQEKFESDVREALGRLEGRRDETAVSPRGGLNFQDAVTAFVSNAVQGAPCTVEDTGNTTGTRARCKVGDLVARFTEESAFAGQGVVFESKRDASYTTQKALEELDVARANRNASAGVFVMAKSHAPAGFPLFARHGRNVIVTWDDQDATTDPYLHAGVLLGIALVTRAKSVGDEGDLEALRDIEGRIESELSRLDKMRKSNDSIRKNSDTIGEEIRKAENALDLLLRKAKSTLTALNVELTEEAEERVTPISFDEDALGNVRNATDDSPPATGTDLTA